MNESLFQTTSDFKKDNSVESLGEIFAFILKDGSRVVGFLYAMTREEIVLCNRWGDAEADVIVIKEREMESSHYLSAKSLDYAKRNK